MPWSSCATTYSPNPTSHLSSVLHILRFPKSEKRIGYHTTQKPLRLVRGTLLAFWTKH